MIFRTREVDGEQVLTGPGCLLIILSIPLWPLIILCYGIYRVIYGNFFSARDAEWKPNTRHERNGRTRNSNERTKPTGQTQQGTLGSERWRQRRFFSKRSGLDPAVFWLTEIRYGEVKIPKSTGGNRILSVPEDDLKSLQAKLASHLQLALQSKVHKCANAYVPGRSILTNARPHLGCAVLIKLDIKQFFDSVKKEQIRPWVFSALRAHALTERVVDLVFSERGLPQGAPTSPLLSNLVLRRLDIELYRECNRLGAIYTRYADDITISLKEDDSAIIKYLIKIVEGLLKTEGFVLNKKKGKLQVLRPHQAQRICGVTINSGRLSISRQQRRILRAAKHRRKHGAESTLSDDQLAGWAAYVGMVMHQKPHG